MSKYIDAEKLLSEIERYINHYEMSERNDFNHSRLVQTVRKGIELGLNARKEE